MTAIESESQLLERAIAGDQSALAQLLLVYYDPLRDHIAVRISPEVQGLLRPEDVLQQTFVRAAEAIADFRPRHEWAFRGWLMTIADNLIRDALKRQRRERRERDAAASGLSARVQRLIESRTSPSGEVALREMVRRMRMAMTTLPDEQQDVLRRRYFLGHTLDQMAAATGRSKNSVRSLCFRARKNLRAAMGRTSLYFSG